MDPDENNKRIPAKKKRSRVRRLLLAAGGVLALCAVLGGLALLAADLRVEHCAAGRVYSDVDDIPVRDMARELIAEGVAPEDVLSDYAGFRTLDSVVRARNLFGATELTVITQGFHCERAIYLAARHGIDAVGFEADEHAPQPTRLRLAVREAFARVLAVLDAEILKTKPHFEY